MSGGKIIKLFEFRYKDVRLRKLHIDGLRLRMPPGMKIKIKNIHVVNIENN